MGTIPSQILALSVVLAFLMGSWSRQFFSKGIALKKKPPPEKRSPAQSHAPMIERQLSLSEEASYSTRGLLAQAPIGYLEVDDENQLLWINPLACQILGMSCSRAEELPLPRLLLELIRSYELDQLIDHTRQSQTRQEQDWTLHLVSPDPINPNAGISHPLRGFGVPLKDNHIGVFLENRQEATTLMQQRDRWTSDVAHELKTPLTSIRLVAETLRDRVDPALTKWLDRLLNEILRLSNMVEDLLNLSHLKRSGGTGLTLKPVELPRLLFNAWQSLEPLANIKQIEIAYDGASDLIVKLDEGLMYRVLINLIDNAIKYSPHEGTITIRADLRPPDTESSPDTTTQLLLIEVIDEGTGFRASDLPNIFDRFYRADPSRSRQSAPLEKPIIGGSLQALQHRSSGTGLGLAIVQQIVEAHGGTTQAYNHPETGGGWLTLRIPVEPLSIEEVRYSEPINR